MISDRTARRRLWCGASLVTLALGLALLQSGCLWRLYKAESRPPELLFATTEDGWKIALHRYAQPKGKARGEPVLFCHGIASNRFNWDIDSEHSLPRYLHERGYDVWLMELRGHGDSDKPDAFGGKDYSWDFDTYVQYDMPAAVDFVRQATGAERVGLVGHSMGGLVSLAYVASYPAGPLGAASAALPERSEAPVSWIVTLGAPVRKGPPAREAKLIRFIVGLEPLVKAMPFVPGDLGAKMIAPFSAMGETFWDLLIWNKSNMESSIVKQAAANATENIAPGVALQFIDWIKTGTWRSRDGSFDYRAALGRITVPVFIGAGTLDALAPPTHAEPAFDLVSSASKRYVQFGRANGFSADYGHVDMCLGKRARKEVFPLVASWIDEVVRSQRASRSGASGHP